MWLAPAALLAACSSSPGAQVTTSTPSSPTIPTIPTIPAVSTAGTVATASTVPASAAPATTVAPPVTLVPVDPSLLMPVAIGNKPFAAPADGLATENNGYTGDPNATLQAWLITPIAVPSGPDVRLLGFERTVGINSTSATFLTGPIDPEAALAAISTALAPVATYTVTPSMRTEGTVTIHAFDAQPNTVQGDPPGWSVEASFVNQLGIVRITRSDYTFDKVAPAFSDLPTELQSKVVNQDAIAVNVGGVLSSITYEYGVTSLGDSPAHRTRLTYDIANDVPTATTNLGKLLTTGWEQSEQSNAVYFTSTTTAELWTLDDFGGTTHLTYDTGS
jgi:hypothetical protein